MNRKILCPSRLSEYLYNIYVSDSADGLCMCTQLTVQVACALRWFGLL